MTSSRKLSVASSPPSMSKDHPPNSLTILIILGLAVANTLASVTASFPVFQLNETLGATGAKWGIALNFWGIAMAWKWVDFAQARGYKIALVSSCLLLGLLNTLSPASPSTQSVFLVLRALIGVAGAAPLYLAPRVIASVYTRLEGTNASIMVLSIVGGLALGPVLSLVAVPGTFFSISSIFIACVCMVNLPDDPKTDRVHKRASILDGRGESATYDDKPSGIESACAAPTDSFILQGTTDGTLLGTFCLILYFVCAHTRLGVPCVVLFVGSALGASAVTNEPSNPYIYKTAGLGSKLLSITGQEAIIWQLCDGAKSSLPLACACGVYGYGLVGQLLPIVSLQVESCARYPSRHSTIISISRYISCGVVTTFAIESFERFPKHSIPLPFLVLGLIPSILVSLIRLTSISNISDEEIVRSSCKGPIGNQLKNLSAQAESLRASLDKLQKVLCEQEAAREHTQVEES